MGRKLVSTTVYLRPDQLDFLRAKSNETKAPWAHYIRVAVDEWIRTQTLPAPTRIDFSIEPIE